MGTIKFGNRSILQITKGKRQIADIFYGSAVDPIYHENIDYSLEPLTFICEEAGSTIRKQYSPIAYYSTDKETWTLWSSGTTLTLAEVGDRIYVRGENTTINNQIFVMTGRIAAKGNVLSLIYGGNLNDTNKLVIQEAGCFSRLFKNCTALTTAPLLTATTLTNNCYYEMFRGCTNLIYAPRLPATTLASQCYYSMFSGCSSMTLAPQLPATTLGIRCYYYMFYQCTSLKTLPELPATTLPNECYYFMFGGCSNIKVSATQTGSYQTAWTLPNATTGTNSLYRMFNNTGGTFTGTPTVNTTYYLDTGV